MKKHFLAILATILMFSTIAPTFSFAVGNKTTVNIEEDVNKTNEYSTNTADSMFNNSYEFATEEPSSGVVGIQPAGFKGWAIQIGIDALKIAVKQGGSILSYALKFLDKDAAKYVKSNSSKMTKALDKLDNWIDEAEGVTQSTIKSRLNTYLKNAGVPSKYSLQIAAAFARAITWFIM